jgi:protein SCO1/2
MSVKKTTNLSLLRMILWGSVLSIGLFASVLYFVKPPAKHLGVFGGEFTLQSTLGGDFTQEDLKGEKSLIFFGYTFCPEVCPTTLSESTSWREELEIAPEDLRIIFSSVDPKRDTIEMLENYLAGFGTPIIGLSGSDEEVENIKRSFGIFSQTTGDTSTDEYLVDHTASVFMVDESGSVVDTIAFGEARPSALAKIRKFMGIEAGS